MTHKRVAAVVILIWFVSAIFSGVLLWLLPDRYSRILTFPGIVGLVLTTLVYIRIYLTARRHKNQIEAMQAQDLGENNEMASFASLVKFAVGAFYVYLVILICYLPMLISLVATEINGPSISLKGWFFFCIIFFKLSAYKSRLIILCIKFRIGGGRLDIVHRQVIPRSIVCRGN